MTVFVGVGVLVTTGVDVTVLVGVGVLVTTGVDICVWTEVGVFVRVETGVEVASSDAVDTQPAEKDTANSSNITIKHTHLFINIMDIGLR